MKINKVEIGIKAALAAGEVLQNNFESVLRVSKKESLRDIVTEVDKLAEHAAIEKILKHDKNADIVTEEQGRVGGRESETYWLIDALDGTVNYVNQLPFFCVSVAYIVKNKIEAGIVYAPMYEDLYYAERSIGAFKNEKRIKYKEKDFDSSLFSVAFSGKVYGNRQDREKEFSLFMAVNDRSRGCLRTGAAALNLALLAEGKITGCWGRANKYCDVAAGLIIAELSGATIKYELTKDKDLNLCSYVVSSEDNIKIIKQLQASI